MAEGKSEAKLQPGVAFRLQPDGKWKPEKIPPEALKEAKFSGYLTIQGYRCTVFETPDKNQWAQKSTGTLAEAPDKPTTATQIAEQWLKGHGARYPKTDQMKNLVTTRVSLASRIAARFLAGEPGEPPEPVTESGDMKFTGTLKSEFDGQNNYMSGNIVIDGQKMPIEGMATPHGANYTLGGKPLDDPNDPMVQRLDLYFTDIWPPEDGNWTATVNAGIIAEAPVPTPDEGQEQQTTASQIATRWLEAQEDITSLVQKKLDRDGDDKDYDKAIVDFVNKARTKLPPIDTALERACDVLMKTRDKIEHAHPKVQDRYVQMFLQELAQKQRELEDMRKQLMRGLTVELDRYESEANPIGEPREASYSESAEGEEISHDRAIAELRSHHSADPDSIAEFYKDLGKHDTYDAGAVLAWLGY